LPAALANCLAITVVPVPVSIGNEHFLDGINITPAQVYERLIASTAVTRTSPPSPGQYLEAWQGAAGHQGMILHITVAASLSTFHQTAELAALLGRRQQHYAGVHVIDSGSAAMGQGFVALAAARAVEKGQSLEQTLAITRAVSRKVRLLVTLDTLEFLARASRIPRIASIAGGLLDLKPIIELSRGVVRPLARVRTRRRAIAQLQERFARNVPEGAAVRVAVHHAQAQDEASGLAEYLQREYHCLEMHVTEFTPVMGTYCGPGLLGVAYYVDDLLP
jgi:DegV family protein with EDD domain